MDDLLPCPFCGSDADYETTSAYAFVYCPECENQTEVQSSVETATKKWNTRTPPPGYALVNLEGAEERVAHIVEAGIDLQSGHQAIAREIIRAMREGE